MRVQSFQHPTQKNVKSAPEAWCTDGRDLAVRQQVAVLQDDHGPYSYPIATFTYLIVHMRDMEDCNAAVELVRCVGGWACVCMSLGSGWVWV